MNLRGGREVSDEELAEIVQEDMILQRTGCTADEVLEAWRADRRGLAERLTGLADAAPTLDAAAHQLHSIAHRLVTERLPIRMTATEVKAPLRSENEG